jgi:uncharacterized protein (DUF2236 family)
MNVSDLNVESDPKIFENRFARCRRLLHFLAARILGSQDEAEYAGLRLRAIHRTSRAEGPQLTAQEPVNAEVFD